MQDSQKKPYPCPHCERRFPAKHSLDHHIMRFHSKEFTHMCSLLEEGSSRLSELNASVKRSGRLTPSSNLNEGTRQHSQQKSYQCPHCNLVFTARGSMHRHIVMVHTKEFPYACSLCSKGYCTPGELRAHAEKKHRVT